MDKAKVLLVDDTPTNLEILSEILTPDYRVSVAINGMEALDLATTSPHPDIILLDIMMPGLDGYQVCQALKQDPRTQPIPVLFVTSIDELESEEKGFALGAVDYIIKPIRPSIVLARVKTHLALYQKGRLLEKMVEERTSELERTAEEAQIANVAKSTFLSNISHELRTPLNGIMGMTQLLLQTNPSEEQVDFLEDAWKSSSRLLNMVNDLLALSRVEAGHMELEYDTCDVRPAMENIVSFYRQRAEEKGLEMLVEIDDNVPDHVLIDCARVRQALINLLNNAIRFTNRGTVTFSLSSQNGGASSGNHTRRLTFTIRNTGPTIPSDKQEGIFEAFNIAEDFMTKEHGGAGLGLTTAKRLINLMGGHIWLEKSEDEETVFSFTVPYK